MTPGIGILKKWEQSFSKNVFITFSIHCALKYDNRSSSFPNDATPDVNFDRVLGSEEKIMENYA